MFSRRRFLVIFPVYAAAAHAEITWPLRKKKPVPPPPPLTVYIGTDTAKGVSKGIYQSRFDTTRGQLAPPTLAAATARPSFLAITPMGLGARSLYAVNAINDPAATATTFAIDPKTGALKRTGQVTSGGAGPAYISVDATGHSAFVANYFGSSIASYHIQPDGTLSQPVNRIDFKDHQKFGALGPNSARQDAPHPHCATISPDNRFLLVCDLGTDDISVFTINPDTGQLSNQRLFTNDRPGSGRVTSPSTPTAAGSTASTRSTLPSTTTSGPRRVSATSPRDFWSTPAPPSKPSRPAFPPTKTPPPNSPSRPTATSSTPATAAKTRWLSLRSAKRASSPSSSASPAAARPLATSPSTPPPSGSSAATRTRQRSPSSSAILPPDNSPALPRPLPSTRPSIPSSPRSSAT